MVLFERISNCIIMSLVVYSMIKLHEMNRVWDKEEKEDKEKENKNEENY